ncbi:cysteine hydrolase family protein [Paenibacillus tundrae]|uniref:Nicotinamidase-related amidase n=1 Tax=Paenibacillus tundrae TaxID=528187 RepID=A0ABT9WE02_9BACL|nr:cysteine hydrolase family protein [Paenibacillus tundrae]MDQ0171508.1 nicotinamidase-related amidase [Paenibacillus tundrae]
MEKPNTALIIVDVQKAFDDPKWGERNNLSAEENIGRILGTWRDKGWHIIHIQHTSDNPHSQFHPTNEGFRIKEVVTPSEGEIVLTKKVNSSFISTPLEEHLRQNHITHVVITGLTTPHCVSTTTRMSGNLGFHTTLISDAVAAFGLYDQHGTYHTAEIIHEISLVTLHHEFATILTTDELLDSIGQ